MFLDYHSFFCLFLEKTIPLLILKKCLYENPKAKILFLINFLSFSLYSSIFNNIHRIEITFRNFQLQLKIIQKGFQSHFQNSRESIQAITVSASDNNLFFIYFLNNQNTFLTNYCSCNLYFFSLRNIFITFTTQHILIFSFTSSALPIYISKI